MDLLQLKYFVVVAHLEHMTRSAEELHVSQPSLSKTISSLEKELGVLLFDRRGKYIHLNQYGKVFLKRVEQALSLLADGRNELYDMAGNDSGEVTLAVLTSSNLLPELLTSFRKKYPEIRIHLIQNISGMVSRPDCDLSIYSSALNLDGFRSTPLLTEEILLAVPPDHPLARRTSIRLNEAAGDYFISLKSGHSLRETTDALCRNAGFAPRIAFESDDTATVRGLVEAGLGIALLPSVTWGDYAGSSFVLLHMEAPICTRTISISYKSESYLPQAAQLLRQFIIEFYGNLGSGNRPVNHGWDWAKKTGLPHD